MNVIDRRDTAIDSCISDIQIGPALAYPDDVMPDGGAHLDSRSGLRNCSARVCNHFIGFPRPILKQYAPVIFHSRTWE